jgi:transposase-like protein
MEIIVGDERRRRWSLVEKLRIVAETERPGVRIAEVARKHKISRGLLWNWRSQVRRGELRPEPPPVFMPLQTIGEVVNGSDRPGVSSSSAGLDPPVSVSARSGTCRIQAADLPQGCSLDSFCSSRRSPVS